MMGVKNMEQMQQNMEILNQSPLTETELDRVQKVGRHIYGK